MNTMLSKGQTKLMKHGISPSVQRLAIMTYLLDHRTHPTVDDVFNGLLPKIPTLSKTTVYNTLKLFVEKGLVLYIDIDERSGRFDAFTEPHAHFRCRKCSCIMDLRLPDMQELLFQTSGFLIEEAYINVKGLCNECMS